MFLGRFCFCMFIISTLIKFNNGDYDSDDFYIDDYESEGCHESANNYEAGSSTAYNYTTSDEEKREFIVNFPNGYNYSTPLPIIFLLPGYSQEVSYLNERFGLKEQGNIDNFISIVFSAGTFKSPEWGWNVRTWNDESCSDAVCRDPAEVVECWSYAPEVPEDCADDGVTINGTDYYNACNWCDCATDDISLIREFVEFVKKTTCIDTSRIYLMGFSAGGMMTQRMACEANDIFAGAVAFAGQMHVGHNCEPKYEYPMPYMNIWGLEDIWVPGETVYDACGWEYLPAQQVQEKFAKFNGCDVDEPMETIETISDGILGWQCTGYTQDCTDDTYTLLCQWDGPHDFPINATTYDPISGEQKSASPPGYPFGLTAALEYLSQFQRLKEPTTATTETPADHASKLSIFGAVYMSIFFYLLL